MKTTSIPAPDHTPHYGGPTHPAGRRAKPTQPAPAPARPALQPFAADPELFALGCQMANRAFESGDWQRMRQVFDDANGVDDGARRQALAVLLGLATRGANILDAVGRAGVVRFSGQPPTAEGVVYAWRSSIPRFVACLNQITEGLAEVTRARPGIKITEVRDVRAEAPLDVRVVGMPARVTETTVDRNAAGDIVSSSQISTDFKAASANK